MIRFLISVPGRYYRQGGHAPEEVKLLVIIGCVALVALASLYFVFYKENNQP